MLEVSPNVGHLRQNTGKMREVSIILGHRHHFGDTLNVGREWRRGEGGVAAEFGFQRPGAAAERLMEPAHLLPLPLTSRNIGFRDIERYTEESCFLVRHGYLRAE